MTSTFSRHLVLIIRSGGRSQSLVLNVSAAPQKGHAILATKCSNGNLHTVLLSWHLLVFVLRSGYLQYNPTWCTIRGDRGPGAASQIWRRPPMWCAVRSPSIGGAVHHRRLQSPTAANNIGLLFQTWFRRMVPKPYSSKRSATGEASLARPHRYDLTNDTGPLSKDQFLWQMTSTKDKGKVSPQKKMRWLKVPAKLSKASAFGST